MLQGAKRNEAGAGTRRRLLETLKAQGPKTARELSAILGGGPVAMRVHLRNLLAAGLVSHVEEHQAVGRPVRRYSLTPDADVLFAKHYDDFALKLLDTLVARKGIGALLELLAGWEDDWTQQLQESLPQNGSRLQALADNLSDYGAMATLHEAPEGHVLAVRNCIISQLAWRFPVICEREAAVLKRVLGQEVTMRTCQSRGDAICSFHIRAEAAQRAAEPTAERPSASLGQPLVP
ncbi:MAG TPA: helix-turn-helix domain-containing protein [Polyangia bacterium]|jgi:predicted ArsR family transcriptional regulator